jgi:Clp amino terminal domain, pathogenicity island component
MAEFPASLDNLIAFVKAQHPGGGPLKNLSDAVVVGSRLEEQSDALIGHFVDQARRSGASWSEIGASIGVSKQAAQKRFVFRWEDMEAPTSNGRFSRFTERARTCVLAAHTAAQAAGAAAVDVPHVLVGLTAEPEGLAAVILRSAGLTADRITAEFAPPTAAGITAEGGADADAPAEPWLPITDGVRAMFMSTLNAALNLGHNYIGTEHLLLGILADENRTAERLAASGVTTEFVQKELTTLYDRIKAAIRKPS